MKADWAHVFLSVLPALPLAASRDETRIALALKAASAGTMARFSLLPTTFVSFKKPPKHYSSVQIEACFQGESCCAKNYCLLEVKTSIFSIKIYELKKACSSKELFLDSVMIAMICSEEQQQ